MTKIKKVLENTIFRYIPLLLTMMYVFMPIYWALAVSLKHEKDIMQKPVKLIPNPATFDNYKFVWSKSGFSRYFLNTIYVSGISALAVAIFAVLVAYGLSRFRFKGKKSFMLVFLATQLIPYNMLIIPLFLIYKNMGIIGSLTSLIITYTTVFLPFNAILMKSFVDGIPFEMEEAAMIDGCNRMGVIFRIVLPILAPGLVAIGSFAFLSSWNEYIFPVMFINNKDNFVVSVGLNFLIGQNVLMYGPLAAGSIIALSVPILIFAYIQKFLVQGLSAGSVKG
ncbi:MAG: carbohydrate ABC transporter permease [Clostridiaceae bacterium]|jgi:multiple sugar transport system permease protein|nr:carbohydrate ABC transporter permease [Clostridiaceae bacterium]